MKRIIPIAAIILTLSFAVQAQSQPSDKVQQFRNELLSTVPANTGGGNKTTATYWRVVATGNYAFDGSSLAISDSSKYKYSNARGSAFSTSGELVLDDYGLEARIMFDTALKFQNNGSGLEFASMYIGSYNGSNERTTFTTRTPASGGGLANNTEHRAVYDANGNITKATAYTWNIGSSQWIATGATERTYDGQNNLIKDSSYTIATTGNTPTSKSFYSYDTNGDQVHMLRLMWNGTSFDSSVQTFSTYTNNLVATVTEQYYDNGWLNSSFDTSGYSTGGIYNYNEYREWDTAANDWLNVDLDTRTIGSNGLPASASISEWDSSTKKWEPVAEATLTYDGNDNPITMKVFVYIGGIKLPTPYYISNLYYEHYFNVGIEATAKDQTLNVYPNPATSTINIGLAGRKNAHISLINMTGQTVRTMNIADNTPKTVMNIEGLPSGNYIMSVQGTDAAPQKQMIAIQ